MLAETRDSPWPPNWGNVLFVGSLLWAAGFLGLLVGTGASAEQMPLLIGIAAVVVLIGFGFRCVLADE